MQQGKIPRELTEGYADSNEKDRELDKLIGWDFNWYTTARGDNFLFPAFEPKVLEELPDGSKRIQNNHGIIERIKRLVSMGGFIPCPNHRLMPGSKFVNLFNIMLKKLKKIKL